MRDFNKIITVTKTINQTVNIRREGVLFIIDDRMSKFIRVSVAYYDDLGSEITTEDFRISGDDYDLLMSESPDFAGGKPANEYREVDLWHIIDIIRARG